MVCAEFGVALIDLGHLFKKKGYHGLVTTYATDNTCANDLSMCLLI